MPIKFKFASLLIFRYLDIFIESGGFSAFAKAEYHQFQQLPIH
ncbi:hypothetical protein NMS_1525 [Nonlabens marinus S1-08]|uniref:Uncharacterized protein n=1 Tax=Nonlabens marinus S1-08 TaxID=1454201 RepID=W8VQ92_9FLAO|nr:hypothetical protein NMS_1525 [Nonlabens marinus S1-08]